MKKVTIMDVAHRAGVSMKSVSRVINEEPNVRPELRDKVRAAVAELGYTPNLAARSLAAGRSFIIGLLFDNPSPNYTMKVQEGAYVACRRAGYQLFIEHIDTASDQVEREMAAMLDHRRIDAMIVSPPATDNEAVMAALEAHRVPYLRLSPNSFPQRSSAIGTNDQEAAGEVVRHLWQLGHRHFGIVNGPPTHGAAIWRRAGFFAALAEHGVAESDVKVAQGDFNFSSGIAGGLKLLGGPDRPTAIFATNDDMAAGVFAAAAQRGIRIPDQLSVVGFDDSWIAQSVWPALTTVHQPIAEMAETAVQMLVGRDRAALPDSTGLPCRLVVRGSTAAPS